LYMYMYVYMYIYVCICIHIDNTYTYNLLWNIPTNLQARYDLFSVKSAVKPQPTNQPWGSFCCSDWCWLKLVLIFYLVLTITTFHHAVCPSVCPSLTRQCSIKTAKIIITQTTLHDSQETLTPKLLPKFQWGYPQLEHQIPVAYVTRAQQ